MTLAENQGAVVDARAFVGSSQDRAQPRAQSSLRSGPSHRSTSPVDDVGRTLAPEDPIGKYMADPWVLRATAWVHGPGRPAQLAGGPDRSRRKRQRSSASRKAVRVSSGCRTSSSKAGFSMTSGEPAKAPKRLNQIHLASRNPTSLCWDVGLFLAIPLSPRWRWSCRDAPERDLGRAARGAVRSRRAGHRHESVRTELYSAAAALANGGAHSQGSGGRGQQLGTRDRPLPSRQGRHHHAGRRADAKPRSRPRRRGRPRTTTFSHCSS